VIDDVSLILILEFCSNYENLFESQKRSYDVKKRAYRHIQNEVDRVIIDIEKVHMIILKFAKDYVAMNMRVCLVKKILQFLTRKFKKISENIQREIDRRYDDFRDSHLVKEKIEQWVQKWETLKKKMISLKINSIYSEHIYIQHFLKIERTWASFFCDTWAKLQKTSRRSLDFFEIVNEYRTELKKLVVTSRRQHSTNSTSLQK
jgi:hypothetical protein